MNKLSGNQLSLSAKWWLSLISALVLIWTGHQGWLAAVDRLAVAAKAPLQSQIYLWQAQLTRPWREWRQWQSERQELLFLRQQLQTWSSQQARLAELEQQNQFLRQQQGVILPAAQPPVLARVMSQDQSGWWINTGQQDGIYLRQAALAGQHLAGRVDKLQAYQAHVRRLDQSDWQLQVLLVKPDMPESTGSGVLTVHDQNLLVEQVSSSYLLAGGELVLTQGESDLSPNLSIGVVEKVLQTDDSAVYQVGRVWWPVEPESVRFLLLVYP